jgi:hypothetical protein
MDAAPVEEIARSHAQFPAGALHPWVASGLPGKLDEAQCLDILHRTRPGFGDADGGGVDEGLIDRRPT